jgi:hypothetical protein
MSIAPQRFVLGLAFVSCAAGCSATRTRQVPPNYPRSQQVLCHYVGLEASTRPTEADEDTIAMLAVYRFNEPNTPPTDEPLTVKFQVDRSRVDELREHLERQPEVLCSPDANSHPTPRVKPFVPSKAARAKRTPQPGPNGELKAPAAALQPSAADGPARRQPLPEGATIEAAPPPRSAR